MLESLLLRNFQTHKKLLIQFDPTITTIVGTSDVGKTSIVRALGLVCFNRPSGDAYIRNGEAFTLLKLKADGRVIVRKRGKENLYRLDNKEFKAFGQGIVPDEIAALLNISPINVQEQLDPHFWFSESPGQVSRNLNEIVNLDIIDSTLTTIASVVRKAKATVEITHERLTEAKEKRNNLKWVKEFNSDLIELEKMTAEVERSSDTEENLSELISRGTSLESRKSSLAKMNTEASILLKLASDARMADARAKGLETIVTKIREVKALVQSPVPDLSELEAIRKEADQIAERTINLEMLLDSIKELRREKCRLNASVEESQAKLQKLTKGRCPLCKQKYTDPSQLCVPTSISEPDLPLRERRVVRSGSRSKQTT